MGVCRNAKSQVWTKKVDILPGQIEAMVLHTLSVTALEIALEFLLSVLGLQISMGKEARQ